jgi:glycosyltransferase involved in cell wall biosynthesis
MRVAYFGTWERGYPRNEQVISCLRKADVEVEEIHVPAWHEEQKFALGPSALPRLALAEGKLAMKRIPRDIDALIVGYPGQFDIAAARVHRRPVVFNAMVSLYETFVEDRRRFPEGSLAARGLRALDRFAFRAADALVSDTAANAAAMAQLAGLEQTEFCFVGAEERRFRPSWKPSPDFHVLFVGKLIPLHGVSTILEAARLLPNIAFRVIGSGQGEGLLQERPANVEHVPWVDYELLPAEYARAGCALGIFGTGAKAARVIPNKVFQALACGTPVITADTAGVRELLSNEVDALLVPPGSPAALARAIERMLLDPELRVRIGAAGYDTFRERASEDVLGRRWRSLLEKVTVRSLRADAF